MSLALRRLLVCTALAGVGSAQAAGVIDIVDNLTDVVATASGSFNTTSLTSGTASAAALVWGGFEFGSLANIGGSVFGAGPSTQMNVFAGISGPSSFGTGSRIFASSATGDRIGVSANAQLQLPLGYVSGTFLSGTATWANQSLSSLGLTPGQYVWTWGSGATADSLTLNISVVPEPSTAVLLLVGLAAAAPLLRRRLRKA